jgi:hypothetical protein
MFKNENDLITPPPDLLQASMPASPSPVQKLAMPGNGAPATTTTGLTNLKRKLAKFLIPLFIAFLT